MGKEVRVIFSEMTNPWFNMGLEEWIFRNLDSHIPVLYLWRNHNSIIIGKFQNPWVECDTQSMENDGIQLARRTSGGGAVFHDLGNTNFTFLNSKDHYNQEQNFEIIKTSLRDFGVDANLSGRNDLVVETINGRKKVSGSAFKESKDSRFHHGTLLIDADMEKLGRYLTPRPKKLKAKGISSVKARVANLKTMNDKIVHEKICSKIVHHFFDYHQMDCSIEKFDETILSTIPALKNHVEKFSDWKWRFGETPQFNHHIEEQLSWGGVDVHFDTNKGVINQSTIFSDSLHPEMIDKLSQVFIGSAYTKNGVVESCKIVKNDLPMISDYIDEFQDAIIQHIQ
jgi:lipoate---protein ligase